MAGVRGTKNALGYFYGGEVGGTKSMKSYQLWKGDGRTKNGARTSLWWRGGGGGTKNEAEIFYGSGGRD
jgi:hypothetical protein